jgi:hypothetical protein
MEQYDEQLRCRRGVDCPVTKRLCRVLGTCWARTGEDDGRRHAAGTGPSDHLSWARQGKAKQQAEGGGGRWILSALSRLNYSSRPSSANYSALSRLGCASEERGLTDDGRPRAPTYRLGPTHDSALPYCYFREEAYIIMFCADTLMHQAKLSFRFLKTFLLPPVSSPFKIQLSNFTTFTRELSSFSRKVSLDSSREHPQTPSGLAYRLPRS